MTYRYAIIDTRDRAPGNGVVGRTRSRHRTIDAARRELNEPRLDSRSSFVAVTSPYIIVELEDGTDARIGGPLTRREVVDQGGGTIATY